jgi:hypothetical protein
MMEAFVDRSPLSLTVGGSTPIVKVRMLAQIGEDHQTTDHGRSAAEATSA